MRAPQLVLGWPRKSLETESEDPDRPNKRNSTSVPNAHLGNCLLENCREQSSYRDQEYLGVGARSMWFLF